MRRIALNLLLVSTLLVYNTIYAADGDIQITQASLKQYNQAYFLQATVNYQLNDDIIEALNNGITLTFNATLSISEHRRWMWNKRIATFVFPYRLTFHTLSQTYQINDVTNNRKQVFSGLTSALQALSTIEEMGLNDLKLDPTQVISAKLGVALNIEALPLPMRPLAYVTPNWHAQSNSYQWQIEE